MRYLIPLPLIFFGVMFYVGGTVPEMQIPIKSSASEKNQKKKRHKKDIIYHAVEKPHHPIDLVKNDHQDFVRDEKIFGDPWQEELFYLLKHMEPDRGEMMFQAYVEEMRTYEDLTKNNLTLSLNNLSAMNGESGHDNADEEGRTPASAKDPFELEIQHEKKLKKILGEHYELVLEQEKLFNEERSIEQEI